MNDLTVTITGWVATDPKIHVVPSGTDLVSFRLASTSRFFDRAHNKWVDRDTEWFTVRVFRVAAQLVLKSIRKGQPIVVVGRLHTNEWKAETGMRTDLVIDAQTLGHDLTRGVADFARAVVDAEEATEEPAADAPIEEAEVAVDDAADEKVLEDAPF